MRLPLPPQKDNAMAIEEIVAAVNEARARIKTGVLADVQSNGLALSAYLTKHKLEPTPDNFYKAITVLANTLVWVVKPAALVAAEQNKRPTIISEHAAAQNPDDFEAKVRAG